MPILMTLMFTYIFGGALAGSSTAYVQRLIPGLMVFTVLVGALIREMVRVLRPSAPLLIVTTRPDFLGSLIDAQWGLTCLAESALVAAFVCGVARGIARAIGETCLVPVHELCAEEA